MILKGIDTLEFGLDVTDYLETFSYLLISFKKIKEQSQKTNEDQIIELNDVILTVHRTGINFYAFRLSCKDFILYFMDKQLDNNSPIFVKFLSGYIWSYGCEDAFNRFLEWFSYLTPYPLSNRLSRIDLCVDTDEINFNQTDSKGVVTRARRKQQHFVKGEYKIGRKFSGFTFGSGSPLLARIYNKTLEVRNSGKEWFKDIWIANGWDANKNVWRVEYQIRREVLKEFSIYNLEDLFNNETGLWAYLTKEWLSIHQPSKDNISRWKLKRKWKLIQSAGLNYEAIPLIRNKVKSANIKRLLDQAAGLMLSVAAINDHETLEETSNVFKTHAEQNIIKKNTTFVSEKYKRRQAYISELKIQ